MTVIIPKRFGLKYAPTPTLALEYEEQLPTNSNESIDEKGNDPSIIAPNIRRLHIVQLPKLSASSSVIQVMTQLQHDNERFFAPQVVNEDQLRRLLIRLMDHLQANEDIETEEKTSTYSQLSDEIKGRERDERQHAGIMAEDEAGVMLQDTEEGDNVVLSNDDAASSKGMEHGDEEAEDQESIINYANENMNNTIDGNDSEKATNLPEIGNTPESAKALDESEEEGSEEEIESEELEYFSDEASEEDSF